MKKILTNVLIMLFAAICRAEDEELPVFESEKIVITATRYEVNRKDVSAVMDVISKDEIEKTNANTVTEVLAKNSAVDVIFYPSALSTVSLRGFAPEIEQIKHHVLLIDGRRAGAVNLATMFLSDIERIEVLKGPASSLYGSEAMAGVINIITQKSQGKIETKVDLEGGNFGYWRSNVLTGGAINERLNFDFTLTGIGSHYYEVPKFSIGDWKWKGDTWKGNSYKNYNGSIRAGYNINENHSLNLRSDLFLARDVRYFGDIYGINGPGRKNMDRYSVDLSYQGVIRNNLVFIKGFLAKDKDLIYSNQDFQNWPPEEVPWYKSNLSSSDYAGLQIQNTIKVPIFNQLTFGFDYNYDKTNSKVYNPDGSRTSPFNPDNQKENFAGFMEDKLSFTDNKLILTVGSRYDLYILKTLATPYLISSQYRFGKEALESVNPRAGAVYKFKDVARFHSSLGTAFIVPNPIEKAGSYTFWGITYYGNPDLKPERSLSFDAGCEFTVSVLNMDFTYFHTDVKDKIERKIITDTESSYENIAQAEIRGIENTFSVMLGQLLKMNGIIRVYSNATYLFKAEDITNNRDIYNVAKMKINCGLDYRDEKFNGRINFRYMGKMKESNMFTSVYIGKTEVTYGDFMIADFYLSYAITSVLSVNCKVNNMFNKIYQEKPGYPMPGRNFIAGIAVTF
jgi:vitamin B12 transporter